MYEMLSLLYCLGLSILLGMILIGFIAMLIYGPQILHFFKNDGV